VETLVSKYSPKHLVLRPSDALHYVILDYYLNQEGFKYCCSGTKNILHDTNTQEYLCENFGYKKVFCKLHIRYADHLRWLVYTLYHFRAVLKVLDGVGIVHKVNGVLAMEEIVRTQNKENKK
jgi:hypothetical protein